jgi:hypothetical protein
MKPLSVQHINERRRQQKPFFWLTRDDSEAVLLFRASLLKAKPIQLGPSGGGHAERQA